MANQQLIDYIQKAKEVGKSEDQIKALLYQNGWSEAEVQDAFRSINSLAPQTIAQSEIPVKTISKSQYQRRPMLAIILGLAAILLIIAGVLFYYQQMSSRISVVDSEQPVVETSLQNVASWNTYANSQQGFEIKYPSDWPAPATTSYGDGNVISTNFNGKIFINYYKKDLDLPNNELGKSLDAWLNSPNNYYFNAANFNNMHAVVVGNNYPAIKTYKSYCNGVPLLANEYFIQKGGGSTIQVHGNIYEISGPMFDCPSLPVNEQAKSEQGKSYQDYEKILNTMLATFKIIDGAPVNAQNSSDLNVVIDKPQPSINPTPQQTPSNFKWKYYYANGTDNYSPALQLSANDTKNVTFSDGTHCVVSAVKTSQKTNSDWGTVTVTTRMISCPGNITITQESGFQPSVFANNETGCIVDASGLKYGQMGYFNLQNTSTNTKIGKILVTCEY